MGYDLSGRAVYPLSDLLTADEFPIGDFVPSDLVDFVFQGLYYTDAHTHESDGNLVIDVRLVIEAELALSPPGCDAFAIVFGSAGPGWSTVAAQFVLGPDFSVTLREATIGLRVSTDILRNVATDGPGEIYVEGDIRFAADGITLVNLAGGQLDPSYLCGTELIVEADDVLPVFGTASIPGFDLEEGGFEGLVFETLRLTLPSHYLSLDPGSQLAIEISHAMIGTTGFTGNVFVGSADLDNPVSGTLLGFPFRFREFTLDILQNALIDLTLCADIRIAALEEQGQEKWLGIDFAFGADGSFSGRLSASQPAEAGSTATAIASLEFQNVLRMQLSSLRLEHRDAMWAVYLSGGMELLIQGAADWPEVEFDEIGVNSNGELLLPDGAGIVFASPLVVNWHFVRLTVDKFRFGYAPNSRDTLEVALSAEVAIIDGLPAGASVEGLTVRWKPRTNDPPEVSFRGIGLSFGVPGTFNASIALSYIEENGAIEFRGQGTLELTALDMGIEVGIIVGRQSINPPRHPEAFVYLYLFADARLLPTGIPIGNTGCAIYGFQGLLAYNMALDLDEQLPPDERYYELFVRAPQIGVTHVDKWKRRNGQNALGFGIVLGTQDKGFSVNVKGLLAIAFPDITILLQARANFVKLAPDLSTQQEGTLDALMVYASGQNTLSIDILAYWAIPSIVEVRGNARAFFSFADPGAWYIEIGVDQDGKRIAAQALQWGGKWLFSAGFWFRLDRNGVVTGMQIDVELRASSGGFWVEAVGGARGQMAMYFKPAQAEGSLRLYGRVGAGYRGVSIGFSFDGYARARVDRPFDVLIEVEACISLLFFDACASFDFHWDLTRVPQLESPLRRWSAKPRHWTPRQLAGNAQDTGVVTLARGQLTEGVAPHSSLTLDFARSIVDATQQFDEAVSLDNGGYTTIGRYSGYSASYVLHSLELIREPAGASEVVDIFGVWARETLEVNSSLRLMSSERFGHDGSLSHGFVDGVVLDYCDEPHDDEICIDIAKLKPGYGWLPGGVGLYHLAPDGTLEVASARDPQTPEAVATDPETRRAMAARQPLGALGRNDTLRLLPQSPIRTLRMHRQQAGGSVVRPGWCERFSGSLAATAGVAALAAIGLFWLFWQSPAGAAVLPWAVLGALGVVALCVLALARCRWRGTPPDDTADQDAVTPDSSDHGVSGGGSTDSDDEGDSIGGGWPGDDAIVARPRPGGVLVKVDGPVVVVPGTAAGVDRICFPVGHGPADWEALRRRGGTITETQNWNVPPEAKVLRPDTAYRIALTYSARIRHPDGRIEAVVDRASEHADFRTSGPPARANALVNYVHRVYPSDGARPVYAHYDFAVDYVEDYVPYLYASVGEQLMLRLFDGQGHPLTDAQGGPLLLPASAVGAPQISVTEQVYEEIYRKNAAEGCIGKEFRRTEQYNRHSVSPGSLDRPLTPNSQYRVQIVSSARPDVGLFEWSFTTSRFTTFTDMVTRGIEQRPASTVGTLPAGNGFDALANAAGLPTVRYVDELTLTPLTDGAAGAAVQVFGLLLETPEPMAADERLSVEIAGRAATLVANADHTRCFALPAGGTPWTGRELRLRWQWRRDAGPSLPVLAINGDRTAEIVSHTVELPE